MCRIKNCIRASGVISGIFLAFIFLTLLFAFELVTKVIGEPLEVEPVVMATLTKPEPPRLFSLFWNQFMIPHIEVVSSKVLST